MRACGRLEHCKQLVSARLCCLRWVSDLQCTCFPCCSFREAASSREKNCSPTQHSVAQACAAGAPTKAGKPTLALVPASNGVKFTFAPASPDAVRTYRFVLKKSGAADETVDVAFDSSDLKTVSGGNLEYTWASAPSGSLTGIVRWVAGMHCAAALRIWSSSIKSEGGMLVAAPLPQVCPLAWFGTSEACKGSPQSSEMTRPAMQEHQWRFTSWCGLG